MLLGRQIAEHLPFLRRYARALSGSQREGDALVRATLESAVDHRNERQELKGGRVALYAAFTRVWQNAQAHHARDTQDAYTREGSANAHLSDITPRQREALLLIALEEFTSAQAGEIMGIPAAEAAAARFVQSGPRRPSRTGPLRGEPAEDRGGVRVDGHQRRQAAAGR